MRNRDKERELTQSSLVGNFLSIYRKFRDCLAVHSGANVVSVFSFFLFKPLLGYLNYFDTETVVAVGTGDGAVTGVALSAASVFSGGAVPGNAELCPGIEYCGLN